MTMNKDYVNLIRLCIISKLFIGKKPSHTIINAT